ncbi:MAG TPA: right-handed parallel beta-helix repeat-containing protein, partial [Nitrososphaerales archaeon]|nr:right-handed parallel beta-helix repeat-containing protein [Nitrososphaerales archaeon]
MRRLAQAVTVFLLLSVSFLVSPVASQPSQGNWVVTGTLVVQNESITLNGNLTVESGGNLTLSNVVLTVNGHSPGQYSIYVAPGGSLYIYDSTITAANLQDGYSFVVSGSHFVMKGSSIHGVGWCLAGLETCSYNAGRYQQGSTTYPYGLEVLTNNALIQGNVVSMNVGGIGLSGLNEILANNTIESDPLLPISLQSVSNSTIESNFVNDTTPFPNPAIQVSGWSEYNLFRNNTISCREQLISGDEVSCFGLEMGGAWKNVVLDNRITNAAMCVWLQGGSSDNTVAGNRLEVGIGSGLYILDGVGNRILNNSIQISPQWGGIGMTLTSAHNSTIIGNEIFGGQGGGINMD